MSGAGARDFEGTCRGCGRSSSALDRHTLCRACTDHPDTQTWPPEPGPGDPVDALDALLTQMRRDQAGGPLLPNRAGDQERAARTRLDGYVHTLTAIIAALRAARP